MNKAQPNQGRSLTAILTLLVAASSLALTPAAVAHHGHLTVKPLIDAGVTIIVTEDGTLLPGTELPTGPVQVLSAAEYKARYEHPEGALENPALPSAPPSALDPTSDVIYEDIIKISALGWGAQCTPSPFYCLVTIRPAADTLHAPTGVCNWDKSVTGINRFQSTFGVTVGKQCVINNCWNASDEGASVSASQLLADFKADILNSGQCPSPNYQTQPYELSWGWANTLDHNGIAYGDDWFSIGASYQCSGCAKWDNDEIIQHEISHSFNAGDRGTFWWEGDGIMNYYDAYLGINYWAQPDYNIVGNNMKGCTCYGPEV